jgi:hypothetical protein
MRRGDEPVLIHVVSQDHMDGYVTNNWGGVSQDVLSMSYRAISFRIE